MRARLVVASAPFRRDGMVDGFWDGLAGATYADLPEPYREADLAVSGDPAHAERMFHLDRELMLTGLPTGPTPWSPRSPHRRSLWRPTAM
jgi:hypothetical protein